MSRKLPPRLAAALQQVDAICARWWICFREGGVLENSVDSSSRALRAFKRNWRLSRQVYSDIVRDVLIGWNWCLAYYSELVVERKMEEPNVQTPSS